MTMGTHEGARDHTSDSIGLQQLKCNLADVIELAQWKHVLVRGDLEHIVAKALRKRPAEPDPRAARRVSLSDPRVRQPSLRRGWLTPTYLSGDAGEVWMLDGSQSVFGPEPIDDATRARAAGQDIHPTGPQWGLGELRSRDAVRALEEAAVEPYADLRAGLEAAGMKQERRALRVRVHDLQWQWPADDELELRFALAPGAYATGLLTELGEVADVTRG